VVRVIDSVGNTVTSSSAVITAARHLRPHRRVWRRSAG
jgi:hypothetical protein